MFGENHLESGVIFFLSVCVSVMAGVLGTIYLTVIKKSPITEQPLKVKTHIGKEKVTSKESDSDGEFFPKVRRKSKMESDPEDMATKSSKLEKPLLTKVKGVSKKIEVLDWMILDKIEAKTTLSLMDKEKLKSFHHPPKLTKGTTFYEFKKSVFKWATELVKLGFEQEDLTRTVKDMSFGQLDSESGAIGCQLALIKKLFMGNQSEKLGEIMMDLDERISPHAHSIQEAFEAKLVMIRRREGEKPLEFLYAMEGLFNREALVTNRSRPEYSRIEVCMTGLCLDQTTRMMIRMSLSTKSHNADDRIFQDLVSVVDSLHLLETTRYDKDGRIMTDTRNVFEELEEVLDPGRRALKKHFKETSDQNQAKDDPYKKKWISMPPKVHYLDKPTESKGQNSNSGTKGSGKGTQKGQNPMGKGASSDDKPPRECMYGENCRYMKNTGQCRFFHSDKAQWKRMKDEYERNQATKATEGSSSSNQ